MPTYVTLLKFTDKGIKTIKEAPKRIEDIEALMRDGRARD